MPLGIKPIVDFVFKKVFGSPENVPILIGLLNAISGFPGPSSRLRSSIRSVTRISPLTS
jgi:hypothetical protein